MAGPTTQFHLHVRDAILELAAGILGASELDEAYKISKDLLRSEASRKKAVKTLQKMVGDTPKRPLYYACHEFRYLLEHTRHAVEDLGHYLDHLVKYCAADMLGSQKYEEQSLGKNLQKLKGILPDTLHTKLAQYNNLIYVPAKHNFDVKDRPHLFSAAEAVLACFITLRLAEHIIPLSASALEYSQDVEGYAYYAEDIDDL